MVAGVIQVALHIRHHLATCRARSDNFLEDQISEQTDRNSASDEAADGQEIQEHTRSPVEASKNLFAERLVNSERSQKEKGKDDQKEAATLTHRSLLLHASCLRHPSSYAQRSTDSFA